MKTATVERVTPQQAQEWLNHNPKNRNLQMSRVAKLAHHMREGTFTVTNNGIALDDQGNLVDGQHRLSAVVLSGATVEMVVVRGVQMEDRPFIDIGGKRTPGEHLQMSLGVRNANVVAAAARLLNAFMSGSLMQSSALGSFEPSEAEDVWRCHPGLEDSAAAVMGGRRDGLKSVHRSDSDLAFFHYLFTKAHATKAQEFFTKLSTGANMGPTDPVLKLRELLIKSRNDLQSKRTPVAVRVLIVKAWNAHYKGKTVKTLRWSPQANEKMPPIEGLAYDSDGKPVL